MAEEPPSICNSPPWSAMGNRRPSSVSLLAIPATLALAMLASSCLFHHTAVAFTPPPPQAAPVPDEADPRVSDPPLIASLPGLSNESIGPAVVPNGVPEAPAPAEPKPTPRRNNNPVGVNTTPPKPTPVPPADPQPAAPRLGQILSPDKVREYNHTLDESLDRVKRVIANLQRKNLTPGQAEILKQIQVFQMQAEQAREKDLVIAVSIATRADVLAKDLQERVP